MYIRIFLKLNRDVMMNVVKFSFVGIEWYLSGYSHKK